eukprot:3299926-Prymnesium_polylepis.1
METTTPWTIGFCIVLTIVCWHDAASRISSFSAARSCSDTRERWLGGTITIARVGAVDSDTDKWLCASHGRDSPTPSRGVEDLPLLRDTGGRVGSGRDARDRFFRYG